MILCPHYKCRSDRHDLPVEEYIEFISREPISEKQWEREVYKYYRRVVKKSAIRMREWDDWLNSNNFFAAYYKVNVLKLQNLEGGLSLISESFPSKNI